ncbi:HAD family hydrolase [Kitasatospora sp. NBC_00315]|uniref:HAD family hydrolase n=1 Tax=Kitasatospora sp. NBC_00315 TaxID=2975963 RepID=UPI00324F3476
MADIAAALFDVDGTLVDSTYLHTLAWAQALAQFDRVVPMARVHRAVGMGSDQLLDHLLGDERGRDDDAGIVAAHAALYARFWPGLRPLPGAVGLLRECARRGWTVVLASSASSRELAVLRRVLDCDEVISAVTGADDVARSKPAPDLVEAALGKAGADRAGSVFVGDAVWDVRAAARAGVPCVGVESGGFSRLELAAEGASEVHRDAADLLEHLDSSLLGRSGPGEATSGTGPR